MKAVFMCKTTTKSGFLQWSINSVPVEAFDSDKPVPSNITEDGGNVFLFTNRSYVSGNYTYLSTALINVSQTTVVTCSNGSSTSSDTVSLQGNLK